MSIAHWKRRLRENSPLIGAALVVVAGVAVTGARITFPDQSSDEYLPLVGAQRILAGEVPYRDFSTLYTPLASYIDAVLFAVFAPSLVAARAVFAAAIIAGWVVVARTAARVGGSSARGALAVILMVPTVCGRSWGYSLGWGAVLVLASYHASVVARSPGTRRSRGWLFGSGLLLGTAALARHDVALAAILPIALGVVWRSGSARAPWGDLAVFLGGASVGPLVLAGALGLAGAWPQAWNQLVVIPGTVYRETRAAAFPGPFAAVRPLGWPLFWFYGPAIVALLALACSRGQRREGVIVALLVLVLYLPAGVRSDDAHVFAARMAAPLALAVMARGPRTRARVAALVVASMVVVPPFLIRARECWIVGRSVTEDAIVDAGPEMGIMARDGWSERTAAIDFVTRSANGGRIFVGLPNHDSVFYSDVGFYFDARTLPAIRAHALEPWHARESFQREIVAELERSRPSVVVLTDPQVAPGEVPRWGLGVCVLDRYLASHYREAFSAGAYQVLTRSEPR